jgi:hypothetical protein
VECAIVDPRDIQWEEDVPTYRVYFWAGGAGGSAHEATPALSSEEWRLTGATDVEEVLAWATGPTGRGRVFQLYVEAAAAHARPGLLRLAGPAEQADLIRIVSQRGHASAQPVDGG